MINRPSAKSIALDQAIWIPVKRDKACKLQALTGFEGSFYQLNVSDDQLIGIYSLRAKSEKLFIKILDASVLETQLYAEKVARHLFERSITTIRCLEGYPEYNQSHDVVVLVYPFIKNKYIDTSADNMRLLGAELGRLHQALKTFPDEAVIKKNSMLHLERCLSNRETLIKNLTSIGADTQFLEETIELKIADSFMSSPQIIHGDLNYGNILQSSREKTSIIFIDFEETTRSYFSPMVDVAMIIERFIKISLVQHDDRLASFKKGYINETGAWFNTPDQFPDILRSLSARALLLLAAGYEETNQTWRLKEQSKFLELHHDAMMYFKRSTNWQ
tara:strand:+ start:4704 stop:5699 length:996 start_codon:yes stop_codon:yes gene_type:complete